MKIKNILFFVVLIGFGSISQAQNNTNSPYSRYGIGFLEEGGFGRTKAMGGAGIALPSELSLNNLNPASYRGIDSLHFILEAGANYLYSKFDYKGTTSYSRDANLGYLAIGFRINKYWKNSIGISRFSDVGYNIGTTGQIIGSTNTTNVNMIGNGGLQQIYWGNAFQVSKNFSLGVNASYIFGSITKQEQTSSDYFSGTVSMVDESRIRNFYLSYGAQYAFKIGKKLDFSLGAIYGAKTLLHKRHQYYYLYSGDTIATENKTNTNLYIPEKYGFGFTATYDNRIMLVADYTRNNWAGINGNESNYRSVDAERIALGLEFVPSNKISAGYFQSLHYRIGGYRENTYIKVKGVQLQDVGITAGVGMPFMRGKAIVNLAVAGGIMGVPDYSNSSVINEQYLKVNLNITVFDFWFNKIKYE